MGWRDRAGRILLDPFGSDGEPIRATLDRRWLWKLEGYLGAATNEERRQIRHDLSEYLHQTCTHEYRHTEAEGYFDESWQCRWCNYLTYVDPSRYQVGGDAV